MTNKKILSETKNILWVDDDVDKPALKPDRDKLESRNCHIVEATRPDVFFEIIKDDSLKIDCIIIDISLSCDKLGIANTSNGTKTGIILIKKLKETRKYQNIPLIVYSVIAEAESKTFCERIGCPNLLDDIPYWGKSIRSKNFADNVVEILEPINDYND